MGVTITRNTTLPDNSEKSDFHNLVDTATTTVSITEAGTVSGSAITGLANLPSAAGIIPVVNIETVPWTDYFATSTIVGWSAGKTGTIYYKKIGKTVFVNYSITGTSDSVNTTFTVPYTNVNVVTFSAGYALDNTSTTNFGGISMAANGAVVTLFSTLTATWTASGTKTVYGQFWFEATA